MDVSFALGLPASAEAELQDRVAKGEVISGAELKAKYSVDAATVSALEDWLKKEGFSITEVAPDGTTIYARAPVSQVEASLGVHMVRVTQDGHTYTSACDVPSLPDPVAGAVVHIGGLQPHRQAQKNFRRTRIAPADRAVVSPAIANAPPYLVSEILKAYDGAGLGLTGAGQEVAILIDTFPLDSDLTAFWTANSVAGSLSRITKINVGGGTPPPVEGEETLDTEWISGIAPNADVRIYASGSLSFVALDKALDRIIADAMARNGLRQVSISLGLGETFMASSEVTTEEAKFVRLAALGVNVFVSTGDAGSNPDDTGHSSTGPLQAEWMSTSPHVVAVGGTTLQLTSAGTVASETGWSGSGGGKSIFFSRPAWQTGTGVEPGNQRLVPDVAAAADPNTGALVILNGQQLQIGGTSWSTPVWAGICALLNESRQKHGKPSLPFLNPLIYPLIGSNAFRDILTGNNGAYSCHPGHDLVTGIGTPDVKQLVARVG
jgi:kumamolisin